MNAPGARRRSARRGVPPRRPLALTGTPGVGKSAVARLLERRWEVREVGTIARTAGAARGSGRTVEVDLGRLRRRWGSAAGSVDVVVGHLAHLLPVRGAIVLRCHPAELSRRLQRARRGSRKDRYANVLSEALDLIAVEARRDLRRVVEVDTTGRTPGQVAREVDRLLRGGRPRPRASPDWLADRRVTAHLLDGPA